MHKNLRFRKNLLTKYILLFSLLTLQIYSAQTGPANTRLIQVNTSKGSMLKLVESTESHIYHVGTANSEIGFDGYNYASIGKDDVYVLKSNVADGTNVWMKTFNAGSSGIILPKQIYIDSSDNVYVFGQFSGSMTVGPKTISSAGSINAFLLKLDPAGNAIWINEFANTDTALKYNVKMAADATDLFMVFSQNHLVKLNQTDGNIIYDKVYDAAVDFRSIALKDDNLYVAGSSKVSGVVFGDVTIADKDKGFIIKGDKNANFTASVQTVGTRASDISDLAFSSDGAILFAGFSKNSMSLKTESNTFTYTYNPNASFTNRIYYYTAKIDMNLSAVSFLRTSSDFTSIPGTIEPNNLSAKIIPYGSSGQFKVIIRDERGLANNLQFNISNSNGTTTTINESPISLRSFLIVCNANGNSAPGFQPVLFGFKMTATANTYMQTTLNSRYFSTKVYNANNSALVWTKEKTSSVGGELLFPFVRHLNSAKEEMFFSTMIDGKSDFFGYQVNNPVGKASRNIARLGINGLPKWTARMESLTPSYEMNSNGDFACVDKDDNFIFLATTAGTTSTFYSANGLATDFQQPANTAAKLIIKIDKNGNLVWTKKMPFSAGQELVRGAVITDADGDLYYFGETRGSSFSLDGQNYPAKTSFIIKMNGVTGTVIFSKSFLQMDSYSILPVFDSQNNLYVFIEPYGQTGYNFEFDGILIPRNSFDANQLMLKFNSAGAVIWGKNFYPIASQDFGASIHDAKFDGENIILLGTYFSYNVNEDYLGLDMVNIPKKYPGAVAVPFIAKVGTNGNVLWQKALHINIGTPLFPNFDLDEQKNIYTYLFVKDKLNYENVEYIFDATLGNKIVQKFNSNGNLEYNIVADKELNYKSYTDVFGVDQINVVSLTKEDHVLNYPIMDNFGSNVYVATFGKLDGKYLTPEKNYLELESAIITNNPVATDNQFSFNLINNVNWTATSDQSWLNLSFTNLAGKSALNVISGNGDAKITLTADQNNSAATRSSNIIISGDDVQAKTIIVTQESFLATGNNKISMITLYPNPTSDYLKIKSERKINNVQIFDMSGKLLISSKINDSKVDVSKLTNGLYLINLITESGVINSKFIKN